MENSRFTEIDFKINISVTDLIALMYYLGKYRWMSAVVCQHQMKKLYYTIEILTVFQIYSFVAKISN